MTDLATVSDRRRKRPPPRKAPGMRNLWSEPASRLRIWGITRPTKPITPVMETVTPVSIEAMMNKLLLRDSMLIPR